MNINNFDAAVLFIAGQSNAHAHAQKLDEKDYIEKPLENVYSLDRKYNQSFDITDVVWSNFTTSGKNLGENQDNTSSMAYYFAKRWQDDINSGKKLPDLYIVQISVGSEAIIEGMWNKNKKIILTPGELGVVDISLYPFSIKINNLVMNNLKKRYSNVLVLGLHWLGSESDTTKSASERKDFSEQYDDFFDNLQSSIDKNAAVYLYKLHNELNCIMNNNPTKGIKVVNDEFERQCKRHDNFSIVDVKNSPFWDENSDTYGIFDVDKIHYKPWTHKWFSDRLYNELKQKFGF